MKYFKYFAIFAFILLFAGCSNEKYSDSDFGLDLNEIKSARSAKLDVLNGVIKAKSLPEISPVYFDNNEDFVVPAILEPSETKKTIKVIHPETLNETSAQLIGSLTIFYSDKEYNLPAYLISESGKEYLFVFFKDKTSGKSTPSNGRYVKVDYEGVDEEEYIIDFNTAFLTIADNLNIQSAAPNAAVLPFEIKAGEKLR